MKKFWKIRVPPSCPPKGRFFDLKLAILGPKFRKFSLQGLFLFSKQVQLKHHFFRPQKTWKSRYFSFWAKIEFKEKSMFWSKSCSKTASKTKKFFQEPPTKMPFFCRVCSQLCRVCSQPPSCPRLLDTNFS